CSGRRHISTGITASTATAWPGRCARRCGGNAGPRRTDQRPSRTRCSAPVLPRRAGILRGLLRPWAHSCCRGDGAWNPIANKPGAIDWLDTLEGGEAFIAFAATGGCDTETEKLSNL